MIENKTLQLIHNLTQQLEPTPWYKKPTAIFSLWFLFIIGYFPWLLKRFFNISILSLPALSFYSLLCFSLLAVTFIFGSTLVLCQSFPGRNLKLSKWMFLTFLAAWLLTIILCYPFTDASAPHEGFAYNHDDYGCSTYIFLIALAPAIALLLLIRILAPTRPKWLAMSALLACSAGAAICLEFICPHKTIIHLLYGHFGAIIAFGLLGYLAGKRLLKW